MPSNEMLDIRLQVSLEPKNISMAVDKAWKEITLAVEKGGAYYPAYEGPYSVDASFYWAKKLATYGKSMTDDITVNAIPVVESSNPQGGKTIVIGA